MRWIKRSNWLVRTWRDDRFVSILLVVKSVIRPRVVEAVVAAEHAADSVAVAAVAAAVSVVVIAADAAEASAVAADAVEVVDGMLFTHSLTPSRGTKHHYT